MMEWINEWVPQLGAGILSLAATLMVCSKGKLRRWSYVVGLVSQPFWYWMTAKEGQWIIFGLSICYTVSWVNGFRNHFLKQPEEPVDDAQELKEALSEALDYLECDRGRQGDLVGCCVPRPQHREWCKLTEKYDDK